MIGLASMTENAYGRLASLVYERDKPIGTSFGDVEYYRARLEECRARTVLEPAVGNGRFLVPLARHGYEIHGFDASQAMLARCRRAILRHRVRASLQWAGFEDFAAPEPFDAVVIPAGSFQLLIGDRAVETALRRIAAHTRRGGRFIFDVALPNTYEDQGLRERVWPIGHEGLLILSEIPLPGDDDRSVTSAIHRYELDRRGRTVARELALFRLRWWTIAALEESLRKAGFHLERVVADYGAARLGEARTLTVEAIRV